MRAERPQVFPETSVASSQRILLRKHYSEFGVWLLNRLDVRWQFTKNLVMVGDNWRMVVEARTFAKNGEERSLQAQNRSLVFGYGYGIQPRKKDEQLDFILEIIWQGVDKRVFHEDMRESFYVYDTTTSANPLTDPDATIAHLLTPNGVIEVVEDIGYSTQIYIIHPPEGGSHELVRGLNEASLFWKPK